jgi:hypothetical protein
MWKPTVKFNKKLYIDHKDLDCLSNIGYINGPFEQKEYNIQYWTLNNNSVIYKWINEDDSYDFYFEWNTHDINGLENYEKLQNTITSSCHTTSETNDKIDNLSFLTHKLNIFDSKIPAKTNENQSPPDFIPAHYKDLEEQIKKSPFRALRFLNGTNYL